MEKEKNKIRKIEKEREEVRAKPGLVGKQKNRVLVDFYTSEKINWTTFAESWFSKIEGGESRTSGDGGAGGEHLCPFSSSLVPFGDAFACSSEVEIWK